MATVTQLSNSVLECGCNVRNIEPPLTYLNLRLHRQLTNATDRQVSLLYERYQSQIQRLLISQFIDHLSLQSLTFDQENSYFATFNDIVNENRGINNEEYFREGSSICADRQRTPTPAASPISRGGDSKEPDLSIMVANNNNNNKVKDRGRNNNNLKRDITSMLPKDCWSRIFQFIDQKSKLLKVCFVNGSFNGLIHLQSSWNELTVHCHKLYYYETNFFKFKQFLMKSGRLIQSLTLFDILTNERDWTLFIQKIVAFCPKICNIRIKSMSNQSMVYFKPNTLK